ncbi:hypothetical protein ABC855_g4082 [[Candida] zeylanoides]
MITLSFFAALFASITYYMLFFSHLAPSIVTADQAELTKSAFLNETGINENQFCYLKSGSETVAHNDTSHFLAVALLNGTFKNWGQFVECDNGVCIYPTEDTKEILAADNVWMKYEESKEYCETAVPV